MRHYLILCPNCYYYLIIIIALSHLTYFYYIPYLIKKKIIIIIIIIMAARRGQRCCACNGPHAVCKSCSCAKKGSKCFSCRPKDRGNCQNTVQPTLMPSQPTPRGACPSPPLHDSPALSQAPSGAPSESFDIDRYMMRAFGDTLCCTTVPEATSNEWTRRWSAIAHLKGRLYHIPGGSIGRRYVDLLSTEISHLAAGNFPSERVMVFSAVVLQRNRMVNKGADIREVMEKRMERWTNDEFDVLVDEAVACNKAIKIQAYKEDSDHFITVFTHLHDVTGQDKSCHEVALGAVQRSRIAI